MKVTGGSHIRSHGCDTIDWRALFFSLPRSSLMFAGLNIKDYRILWPGKVSSHVGVKCRKHSTASFPLKTLTSSTALTSHWLWFYKKGYSLRFTHLLLLLAY